jgi:hypothetical protein
LVCSNKKPASRNKAGRRALAESRESTSSGIYDVRRGFFSGCQQLFVNMNAMIHILYVQEHIHVYETVRTGIGLLQEQLVQAVLKAGNK